MLIKWAKKAGLYQEAIGKIGRTCTKLQKEQGLLVKYFLQHPPPFEKEVDAAKKQAQLAKGQAHELTYSLLI